MKLWTRKKTDAQPDMFELWIVDFLASIAKRIPGAGAAFVKVQIDDPDAHERQLHEAAIEAAARYFWFRKYRGGMGKG